MSSRGLPGCHCGVKVWPKGSGDAGRATFQQALGIAVRQRRLELGLTQEQLALRSGLHQRWISNVETGRRNPSDSSLRRLARSLDVAPSELIAAAERVEQSRLEVP
jgi:transcriptional regulator with XRE-family HTH domain